jgi:hypothetical protein
MPKFDRLIQLCEHTAVCSRNADEPVETRKLNQASLKGQFKGATARARRVLLEPRI